jgi:hypothetical protein
LYDLSYGCSLGRSAYGLPAFYSVYGLTLCVRQPLAIMRLAPAPVPVNDCILVDLAGQAGRERLDNLKPVSSNETPWRVWSRTIVEELQDGNTIYLRIRLSRGIEFLVNRAGTEISAWWPESVGFDEIVSYLIGPILGTVLRLRGTTVLHACAVGIDGRAIAGLGDAEAGKSSLAAAFAQMGYPILTDDLVALADQDGLLKVQPGHTWIMVPPETAQVLFGTSEALPQALPPWPKRRLDLTREGYYHQGEPLPLAAVYLLGRRSTSARAPFVRRVQPRRALLSLLVNSHTARRVQVGMPDRDFDVMCRVVANLPVRRVTPSTDPTRLPGLCQAILDDFIRVSALPPKREQV